MAGAATAPTEGNWGDYPARAAKGTIRDMPIPTMARNNTFAFMFVNSGSVVR